MSDNEWKDANPVTADLPNKGRSAIICIAGGLVLGILTFISMKIRTVGLAAGLFIFMSGIGMFVRMFLQHKQKPNYKLVALLIAVGFLMLLANPRFGYLVAVAGYILFTGAIGLVVVGIGKALKLSWDLGKRS